MLKHVRAVVVLTCTLTSSRIPKVPCARLRGPACAIDLKRTRAFSYPVSPVAGVHDPHQPGARVTKELGILLV